MRPPSVQDAYQGPAANWLASTYGEMHEIVCHPAFRLGFLDALRGRPFQHDDIMRRIESETPAPALERIGFGLHAENADLAQLRYEEGRLLQKRFGLKCRAWGHPDFPPTAVEAFIRERARARNGEPRHERPGL